MMKHRKSPSSHRKGGGRAFFAWTALLAYAACIDLTLTSVPVWREELIKHYGEGVFATITYAGAGGMLAIILGVMLFRRREKKIPAYLALAGVFLFLRHIMRHWITIPVEQIHFIEYGLMGFLSYNALKHHLKGWGLIGAAVLATYLLGMVDECIQGNLANRVGEQRDMYWNGLAGLMGLAVLVFALKPRWIRGPSGNAEYAAMLAVFAFCLPLQGYFNSHIAQFGRLIRDESRGVIFRSRLEADALKSYGDSLEQFKTDIAPLIGKMRMMELLPQVHDRIHEEALVHLFRRGVYERNGNFAVAYKEDAIVDGYFKQFMAGTPLDWPAKKRAEMIGRIGDIALSTYESPVAEHLITKFTAWQMWTMIGLLEILIALGLIRLMRRRAT